MENDVFLSWHKQLQLSALMDFENYIKKLTTCN